MLACKEERSMAAAALRTAAGRQAGEAYSDEEDVTEGREQAASRSDELRNERKREREESAASRTATASARR